MRERETIMFDLGGFNSFAKIDHFLTPTCGENPTLFTGPTPLNIKNVRLFNNIEDTARFLLIHSMDILIRDKSGG